jgi:hypothetical protein
MTRLEDVVLRELQIWLERGFETAVQVNMSQAGSSLLSLGFGRQGLSDPNKIDEKTWFPWFCLTKPLLSLTL